MKDVPEALPVNGKGRTRNRILRVGLALGIVGISVAILGGIIYRQWDDLVNYPWEFRPFPILASFGIYTLALFLVVWVWADMMRKLGYSFGFWKHFRYLSMTNLAKRLPGTVWYIAGRAQFYKEDGVPRRVTSLMSGVEMAVTVISGIVVALVFGIPIFSQYQISLWGVGAILVGSSLFLHPRVLGFVMQRLGADVSVFGYKDLLLWIGCYLFVWLGGGGVLFSICKIFAEVELSSLGYIIGSWTLVGLLGFVFFFSPSNLGVAELGFSFLLGTIMASPVAIFVALGVRVLILVYELFWAFIAIIPGKTGLFHN
ncbi:MAG TPA: hypothetical protein PK530_03070 [Anaerolineales bacterium]|nr:hypothetical protein [Anaerolineales bacterium]